MATLKFKSDPGFPNNMHVFVKTKIDSPSFDGKLNSSKTSLQIIFQLTRKFTKHTQLRFRNDYV